MKSLVGSASGPLPIKNFYPPLARSAKASPRSPPPAEAPVGPVRTYQLKELVDQISEGNNQQLSSALMNGHRANKATRPLFEHIEEAFLDMISDNKLDPQEKEIRVSNLIRFSEDYLELGASIPVNDLERRTLKDQLTNLADGGSGTGNRHLKVAVIDCKPVKDRNSDHPRDSR